MVRDGFSVQTRALLRHLHAVDSLEADHVDVQKIALELLREMPAGKNTRAGAGAHGPFPELLQVAVFGWIFQVAAERGAEIAVVPGRIGDDVVAPVIEDATVGIGETKEIGRASCRERV